MEPTLALLLRRGPAHGYTLMVQLRDFGLGDVDPATVYRALRDMEAQGWVTSTWETERTQGPPRRVYVLTEVGEQMLRACVQELEQARAQLDAFLTAFRQSETSTGGGKA